MLLAISKKIYCKNMKALERNHQKYKRYYRQKNPERNCIQGFFHSTTIFYNQLHFILYLCHIPKKLAACN